MGRAAAPAGLKPQASDIPRDELANLGIVSVRMGTTSLDGQQRADYRHVFHMVWVARSEVSVPARMFSIRLRAASASPDSLKWTPMPAVRLP